MNKQRLILLEPPPEFLAERSWSPVERMAGIAIAAGLTAFLIYSAWLEAITGARIR